MDRLTPAEQGFLLLSAHLGNPDRRPLTGPQLRDLARRVQDSRRQEDVREMCAGDLAAMGCSLRQAEHIVALLEEQELLSCYIKKARRAGCTPITRATDRYPTAVRKKLGLDAPGCLWAKGDLKLLETRTISLVGSRDLQEPNRVFARELGIRAAEQGFTLVSGNARGADRTAQEACLNAGGRVISVLADSMEEHEERENLLYLSEEAFDEPFSAVRALSRNRIIHTLSERTVVAQCAVGKGGTWDGTVRNLSRGWSAVFCFRDHSPAMAQLMDMGAVEVRLEDLEDLEALQPYTISLFDQ